MHFYLLEGLCAWCHSGTSAAQMGCLVVSFFYHSPGASTAPGPPAWWRAVDDPFGSSSFDMGLLSPDTFPSTTTTLLIPSAPLKQGKLPGGESIIALAQSTTFNVRAQMENVHSTTRKWWCTDLLVLWKKWARSSQPTLSLWLSITLKLVEKSFTVHASDWRPKNSACTPVSSVHPHRRYALTQRTNEHTKIHSQCTQIVSKDVTLRVQRNCRPDEGGKRHCFQ